MSRNQLAVLALTTLAAVAPRGARAEGVVPSAAPPPASAAAAAPPIAAAPPAPAPVVPPPPAGDVDPTISRIVAGAGAIVALFVARFAFRRGRRARAP